MGEGQFYKTIKGLLGADIPQLDIDFPYWVAKLV